MLALKPASGKPFLRTSPELEKEIGDKASKLLLQIDYWIRIGKNFIDGKWWTYQSTRDIQAKAFPGWALSTINRTIKRLEELGLVEIANHNKVKYDKTRWFALKPEGLARLQSVILLEDEPRSEQDGTRPDQNGTGSAQIGTRPDQNGTTIPMTPTVNSSMNSTGITTPSTPAHADADGNSNTPHPPKIDDPKPMPSVLAEAGAKLDTPIADTSWNLPERDTQPLPIPPIPPAPPFPDDDTDPDCADDDLKAFFTGMTRQQIKDLKAQYGVNRIYATIKGVAASKNVENPPGLVISQLQAGTGGQWRLPKVAQKHYAEGAGEDYLNGEFARFIQH